MSVILGNATVPSSSTVALFHLPPGYSNMTVFQPSQAQAVYLGTSNALTAANGMLVPVTPANAETYVGSAGAAIYATTGNNTASSFSYILSTTGLQ